MVISSCVCCLKWEPVKFLGATLEPSRMNETEYVVNVRCLVKSRILMRKLMMNLRSARSWIHAKLLILSCGSVIRAGWNVEHEAHSVTCCLLATITFYLRTKPSTRFWIFVLPLSHRNFSTTDCRTSLTRRDLSTFLHHTSTPPQCPTTTISCRTLTRRSKRYARHLSMTERNADTHAATTLSTKTKMRTRAAMSTSKTSTTTPSNWRSTTPRKPSTSSLVFLHLKRRKETGMCRCCCQQKT